MEGIRTTLSYPSIGILFGSLAGISGGAFDVQGPPLCVYGDAKGWSQAQFRNNILTVVGRWHVATLCLFLSPLFFFVVVVVVVVVVLLVAPSTASYRIFLALSPHRQTFSLSLPHQSFTLSFVSFSVTLSLSCFTSQHSILPWWSKLIIIKGCWLIFIIVIFVSPPYLECWSVSRWDNMPVHGLIPSYLRILSCWCV